FEGTNGHPLLLKKEAISIVLKHDGTMGLQGAIAKMSSDFLNMPFVDPGLILDADTIYDYLKLVEYNENRQCPSLELCLKIQDYFHMSYEVKAHSNKVASIAIDISSLLFLKGVKLNINIILAACMLHDIEKGKPDHTKVGAKTLYDMGYEKVSQIVKEHMELENISKIPQEKEVVFLADKMVKGEKLMTIDERFAAKEELYKNDSVSLQSVKLKKKQALELYNYIFNNQ
ncbi:MAG: HD domain-containing protein, partial [Sedimentibacter sp.]